mmetsp:Transcript_26065/g.24906  ORF Transcript_26065/g.24906 Transcript_26065/m.24906 type:complete len:394 (+) Transcript_26065:206-1387(+)
MVCDSYGCDSWIKHSFTSNVSGDNEIITAFWVNVVIMIVASVILLHSAILHGKRYRGTIRMQTDVASIFTLLSSACYFIYYTYPNRGSFAIIQDLLISGLFQIPIQLCDRYMFLERLKAVTRVNRNKNILVHTYIYLILVATWIPFYTLVPIFTDTEGDACYSAYFVLNSIYLAGILTYNFYFTLEFVLILRVHKLFEKRENIYLSGRPAKVIAVKSIGHATTSSLASILKYAYLFSNKNRNLNIPIHNLIIILGLHIWFNISIESLRCFKRNIKILGLKNFLKDYISFGSSRGSHVSRGFGSFRISQRIAAIDSISHKTPGTSFKDFYKDQLVLNLNALPSGKDTPSGNLMNLPLGSRDKESRSTPKNAVTPQPLKIDREISLCLGDSKFQY